MPNIEKNTYTISTANVLSPTTLKPALLWGIAEHVQLAHKSGLDGIELWPTNPIITSQIRLGWKDWDKYGDSIFSAHQSPRGETFLEVSGAVLRSIPDLLRDPKGMILRNLITIAPYLILTDPVDSLRWIKQLSDQLNKKGRDQTGFQINVYPEKVVPRQLWEGLPNKVAQTYPELCALWKARDAYEFVDKAEEEGVNLCLSTHHLRRLDKNGNLSFLSNWEEVIPILLRSGRVTQMHLEILRTDTPGDQSTTILEGKDMMQEGSEITDIKRILRLVAENWRGLVTIEALTSGMKQIIHPDGQPLTDQDLADYYHATRVNLGRIFAD